MVIKEKIVKYKQRAEADRFFNYPYDALEEVLCNAVYHRGYDNNSTIEVRIYPSRICITSFPGPLPPLDEEKLKNNIFDVRKYRNRRIGEFLKELHLTEGRATGIPTIIKSLKINRSPNPIFETDKERTFFKVTLPINPFTLPDDQLFSEYNALSDKSKEIIKFCRIPQKRADIFQEINLSNQFTNYKKFLIPLIDKKFIELTIPDKPKSSKQKYVISQFWDEFLFKK